MRVLVIMDDKEHLGNKTCGDGVRVRENSELTSPIKPVYYLQGKHFIVIDNSIVEKLKFSNIENKELYFQQEVTDDGCIVLRPFKMSE